MPEPETINDIPVTVIAEDVIPTIEGEPPPNPTYVDWKPEETVIKTYTIGNTYYRGIPAESREAAKQHCIENYGRILQENYVQGRAFFRVAKKATREAK